jgi:predicted Fe-S protein YdhL (DUF1289 family)
MTNDELSQRISEGTSRGMVEYWSQARVRERRHVMSKLRRRIHVREQRIASAARRGITPETSGTIALYARELEQARAELATLQS